jgi:hypothetical protein
LQQERVQVQASLLTTVFHALRHLPELSIGSVQSGEKRMANCTCVTPAR